MMRGDNAIPLLAVKDLSIEFRTRSGTVKVAVCDGLNVTLLPSARTVCGREKRFTSLVNCAVTVPPVQRRRV